MSLRIVREMGQLISPVVTAGCIAILAAITVGSGCTRTTSAQPQPRVEKVDEFGTTPAAISLPEPVSEVPAGTFLQVDVFEAATVVPMISVRLTGSLFAASTRAAAPAHHPRAAFYIERTTGSRSHLADKKSTYVDYVVRLEQSPGGAIRFTEADARRVANWLAELDGSGDRRNTDIAASELRLDGVQLTYMPQRADVIGVNTERFQAVYVRRSLGTTLAATFAKLDSLRRQ